MTVAYISPCVFVRTIALLDVYLTCLGNPYDYPRLVTYFYISLYFVVPLFIIYPARRRISPMFILDLVDEETSVHGSLNHLYIRIVVVALSCFFEKC